MRFFKIFLLLGMLTLLVSACASDGSFQNPFASPEPVSSTGSNYFLSEFPDIPVPNELSESRNDSFIVFAPSGIKCGVQRFTGRVELVSLMNTLRRYMSANGWTLRSLLRAKESLLVFEKPDRIAVFLLNDGLVSTELRIFVSSRHEGDSPSVQFNAYTPPAASGAPSGGAQPLQQ